MGDSDAHGGMPPLEASLRALIITYGVSVACIVASRFTHRCADPHSAHRMARLCIHWCRGLLIFIGCLGWGLLEVLDYEDAPVAIIVFVGVNAVGLVSVDLVSIWHSRKSKPDLPVPSAFPRRATVYSTMLSADLS